MHNKHLEYINGQWCVINDTTGEKRGGKRSIKEEEPHEPEEQFGSRIYLESFVLNTEERAVYPYKIIYPLGLRQIDFAPITIFYGSNGSGKSTLLNIIADNVGVRKKTTGNTNAYFKSYVKTCSFQSAYLQSIPDDSAYIRSEDIMDGIMKCRRRYASAKGVARKESEKIPVYSGKEQKMVDNLLENPDELSQSDRFYLSRCSDAGAAFYADNIADLFESNGEVALKRMQEIIMPDCMYFLDEPEVSLSPVYQQELANMIELYAQNLRTQFVIATHSPFFLSLKDARIYDLDSRPTTIRKWYQLPNMYAYFSLFETNRDHFINSDEQPEEDDKNHQNPEQEQ